MFNPLNCLALPLISMILGSCTTGDGGYVCEMELHRHIEELAECRDHYSLMEDNCPASLLCAPCD